MSELTKLPNIGKELAKKLNDVGITSDQQLKDIGSKDSFIKIDALKNGGACMNMLYALEGAIQGVRWHGLSKERKEELKVFCDFLKKSQRR